MRREDQRPFAQEMARLSETYGEECSALRVQAYFDALEDWSLVSVVSAMRRATKGCRFFPKPADIRGLLEDPEPSTEYVLPAHEEAPDPTALRAMLESLRAKLTAPTAIMPPELPAAFHARRPDYMPLPPEERAALARANLEKYDAWLRQRSGR